MPGRVAADVAGPDQQPVARDLRVVGVVSERADEQARHAQDHGAKATGAPPGTANQFVQPDPGRWRVLVRRPTAATHQGETMTRRLRALTAVAVGTAGALLAASPAGAVPTTDLDPADLPRGADIAVPHLDGDHLRRRRPAGRDRRRRRSPCRPLRAGLHPRHLEARRPRPLPRPAAAPRRQHADAAARQPVERHPLRGRTPAGARCATAAGAAPRSASTRRAAARLVAERGFPDYPSVLGMQGRRVLLTTWERGVFWWDTRSGRTALVTTPTRPAAPTWATTCWRRTPTTPTSTAAPC